MESKRRTALVAAIALFLLGAVSATRADTYTVTNTNGSGPGSLAQAILGARAGDIIEAGEPLGEINIASIAPR